MTRNDEAGAGMHELDGLRAQVEAILLVDESGQVQAANQAARREFEMSEAELHGCAISDLLPGLGAAGWPGEVGTWRDGLGRRRDGSCFPLRLGLDEVRLDGQRLFIAFLHGCRGGEHMALPAGRDMLTGCLDRHSFLHFLERTAQVCEQQRKTLATLFIDLDGFKQINDQHGHRAGDTLLRLVAERFQGCLRDADVLGRMGGDEFAACIPLDASPTIAREMAVRLIASLEAPFVVDDISLQVAASIGISLSEGPARPALELLNEADIAMYQAKAGGGQRVRFFDRDLRERTERHQRLLARIRQALVEDCFELHYLLRHSLSGGRPCALEAVLLWRDEEQRLQPFASVAALAEQYGMLEEIEGWALARACRENAWLVGRGILEVPVVVNLGASLFAAGDLLERVRRALAEAGLPARLLQLQVSEAEAMQVRSLENSWKLAQAGIDLLLSDFAAGAFSLYLLRGMGVAGLKVAAQRLDDLRDDPQLLHGLLGLARGLGVALIADGVASAQQRDWLATLGFDQGQGEGMARCMSLAELAARFSA